MALIDEEGMLLGVVNVIDALAVVLALAVVVAGVAVVSSGGDDSSEHGEPETRYATMDLGEQPGHVAGRIDDGDVLSIRGDSGGVVVTDVYDVPAMETGASQFPGASSPARYVTIRAEVDGTVAADDHGTDRFRVGDASVQPGTTLELDGGSYVTNATVTALDREDPTLRIEETSTVAELRVRNASPVALDGLQDGLNRTVDGETVASIESIETEPATVVVQSDEGELYAREHPVNETATVTVDLRTTETESGTYYGGTRLEIGSSIVLEFDGVTVDAEVVDFQ